MTVVNRFEKITDEQFIQAFDAAVSKRDLQGKLNLPRNGTTQKFIKRTIERLGLDEETLRRNNRLKYFIRKVCPVCKKEFWVPNTRRRLSQATCSHSCANTYFRTRRDYRNYCLGMGGGRCCVCGEENIVQVHHHDGDRNNNELSNLIPLCPTHHQYVHSQFRDMVEGKIEEYVQNLSCSLV